VSNIAVTVAVRFLESDTRANSPNC